MVVITMLSDDPKLVLTFNGGDLQFFQETKRQRFYKDKAVFILLLIPRFYSKLYESKGIDFYRSWMAIFLPSLLGFKNLISCFCDSDRMGVQPLPYYQMKMETFYNALKIKSNFGAGWHKSELNDACLQQYFTFKYVPENNHAILRTFIECLLHIICNNDLKSKSLSIRNIGSRLAQKEYSNSTIRPTRKALLTNLKMLVESGWILMCHGTPLFRWNWTHRLLLISWKVTEYPTIIVAGKNERIKERKELLLTAITMRIKRRLEMNLELITIGENQLNQEFNSENSSF